MTFAHVADDIAQEDFIDLLDGIKWHGKYFSAMCPFDDHAKPALTVYPDGYYCLSCNSGGSLSYLYNHLVGSSSHAPAVVSQKDVDKVFPQWKTWIRKYGDWEQFADRAHENLISFPFMGRYIYNRGISEETIKKAYLGVHDGWAVFPCYGITGHLDDVVVRHMRTKFYGIRPREEGEGTHLFCPDWEWAFSNQVIYVPFGIFDCLSLEEIGLPTMTGISGKGINPELFQGISRTICIIPDYNETDAAIKLVLQLGWRGKLLNINWPDGCKDLNDIHMKYGADALRDLILH